MIENAKMLLFISILINLTHNTKKGISFVEIKEKKITNYYFLKNEKKLMDLSPNWIKVVKSSNFKNNKEILLSEENISTQVNINMQKSSIIKKNEKFKFILYKDFQIKITIKIENSSLVLMIEYFNRNDLNQSIFSKEKKFDFYYPIKMHYVSGKYFIFCETSENRKNNQESIHSRYMFIRCDLNLKGKCEGYFLKFGTLTFLRHLFKISFKEINSLFKNFQIISLGNSDMFIFNNFKWGKKDEKFKKNNYEGEDKTSYGLEVEFDEENKEIRINKGLGKVLIDKKIKKINFVNEKLFIIESESSFFIIYQDQMKKLIYESSKKAKYLEIDKNYVSHYLDTNKNSLYLICKQDEIFARYEIDFVKTDIILKQSSVVNVDYNITQIFYVFEARNFQFSIYHLMGENLKDINLCIKYFNINVDQQSDCMFSSKIKNSINPKDSKTLQGYLIWNGIFDQIKIVFGNNLFEINMLYPYCLMKIDNNNEAKYSFEVINEKEEKHFININVNRELHMLNYKSEISLNGLRISQYSLKLNFLRGNFLTYDPKEDFKTHIIYQYLFNVEVMVNPIIFLNNSKNTIIFQFYGSNKYYFYKFDRYLNLLEYKENNFNNYMNYIATLSPNRKVFTKKDKGNKKNTLLDNTSMYYYVKNPNDEKFHDINSDIIKLSCKIETFMFYSNDNIIFICFNSLNLRGSKLILYEKKSELYFNKLGEIEPDVLEEFERIEQLKSFRKFPQMLIILTNTLQIKFVKIIAMEGQKVDYINIKNNFKIKDHIRKALNLPDDVILYKEKQKYKNNYCHLKIDIMENKVMVLVGCNREIEQEPLNKKMQEKDINNYFVNNNGKQNDQFEKIKDKNELLRNFEKKKEGNSSDYYDEQIKYENLDEKVDYKSTSKTLNPKNSFFHGIINVFSNFNTQNDESDSNIDDGNKKKLNKKTQNNENKNNLETDKKKEENFRKSNYNSIPSFVVFNFHFDFNYDIFENYHFDIQKLMPNYIVKKFLFLSQVPSINKFQQKNTVVIYYLEIKKKNRSKIRKYLLLLNPYKTFHGSMPYVTPIDINYKMINPIRVELDDLEKSAPRFFYTKIDNKDMIVGLFMVQFFLSPKINLENRLARYQNFISKKEKIIRDIIKLRKKGNKRKIKNLTKMQNDLSEIIEKLQYGRIYNFFEPQIFLRFNLESLIFENQDKIIINEKQKLRLVKFNNDFAPFYLEIDLEHIFGNISNYKVTTKRYVELYTNEILILPIINIRESNLQIIPNLKNYKCRSSLHTIFIFDSNFFTIYRLMEGSSQSHVINHIWSFDSINSKNMFSSFFSRNIFLNMEKNEIYQILWNHYNIYLSVLDIPKKGQKIKRKQLVVLDNKFYWNSKIFIKDSYFIIQNMNAFFISTLESVLNNEEVDCKENKIVTEGQFFSFYYLKEKELKESGFQKATKSAFWYASVNFSKRVIIVSLYIENKNCINKLLWINIPAKRILKNSKIETLKLFMDEQQQELILFIFKNGHYHYFIKLSYYVIFHSKKFKLEKNKSIEIPFEKLDSRTYLLSNVNRSKSIINMKIIYELNYLFIYQKNEIKDIIILGYNLNQSREFFDYERFYEIKKEIFPNPSQIYGTYIKFSNEEFPELQSIETIILIPRNYNKMKFFRFLLINENKKSYYFHIEKKPIMMINTPNILSDSTQIIYVNDFHTNNQELFFVKKNNDKNHTKNSIKHLMYLILFTLIFMIMIKIISKIK